MGVAEPDNPCLMAGCDGNINKKGITVHARLRVVDTKQRGGRNASVEEDSGTVVVCGPISSIEVGENKPITDSAGSRNCNKIFGGTFLKEYDWRN